MNENDYVRLSHVSDLWDTIRRARLRTLSIDEIVDRLSRIWEYAESNELLIVIGERELGQKESRVLFEAVRLLAEKAESLSPRDRDSTHRAIRRIVKVLPTDLASEVAKDFICYPRKVGREIVYVGLRSTGASPSLVPDLIKCFEKTGDEQTLELIARNPNAVGVADAHFLLKSLSEPYWRGRVLAALLMTNRELAYSLSVQFPREFAHAVGRLQDSEGAKLLADLLPANGENLDFLALYAYALGRLGHREELERLAQHIEKAHGGPPGELVT